MTYYITDFTEGKLANRKAPEQRTDVYWLGIIGKALSHISLRAAELHNADIGTKGNFLTSLGLDREEVAEMLQTTAETVRTAGRAARLKKGGKKRGKGRQG